MQQVAGGYVITPWRHGLTTSKVLAAVAMLALIVTTSVLVTAALPSSNSFSSDEALPQSTVGASVETPATVVASPEEAVLSAGVVGAAPASSTLPVTGFAPVWPYVEDEVVRIQRSALIIPPSSTLPVSGDDATSTTVAVTPATVTTVTSEPLVADTVVGQSATVELTTPTTADEPDDDKAVAAPATSTTTRPPTTVAQTAPPTTAAPEPEVITHGNVLVSASLGGWLPLAPPGFVGTVDPYSFELVALGGGLVSYVGSSQFQIFRYIDSQTESLLWYEICNTNGRCYLATAGIYWY